MRQGKITRYCDLALVGFAVQNGLIVLDRNELTSVRTDNERRSPNTSRMLAKLREPQLSIHQERITKILLKKETFYY